MATGETISVLLVEDNRGDYVLAREMLSSSTSSSASAGVLFNLLWAETFTAAVEKLRAERVDVILLDLSLPDASGLDCFYSMRALAPNVPILVLTGLDDEKTAIGAVKAGAQDYLVKGQLQNDILVRGIRYGVERYRILLESENAKELAERANRTKSEFIGQMVEEIETPVSGIIELLSIVLGSELTSKQQEFIRNARISAEALVGVLHDLNDFSLLESGRIRLRSEDVDVRKYLLPVIAHLEQEAGRKRMQVQYAVSDEVEVVYCGDMSRCSQVLSTLVGIAVKFGEVGGLISIDVTKDSQNEKGASIHFAIRLGGSALSLEKQEIIFESLTQADTSIPRKYGSTGLSLAVASRLVKVLGGRIWVEAEAGKGSSLHFTSHFGPAQET